MQQFNLDTWLQDKSRKIVTRTNKPVRIVCRDSPNNVFPIVGFVDNKPEIFTWDCFGYCRAGHIENENDLFFADEEDELTEFEKTMIQFSHERNSLIQFEHTTEEINAHLHQYSEKLLDLARKELETNYYTKVLDDRMVFKSDLHDRDMQCAYEFGKQDALKDLPKWEKSTLPIPDEEYPIGFNGKYFCYKGYCVDYKKLFETLPKEE